MSEIDLDPTRTAVVVFEMQDGIVGESAVLPDLVEAVDESGIVERVAALCDGARSAGSRVYYSVFARRPDDFARPVTTPMDRLMDRLAGGRFEPGAVIDALEPHVDDVVLARFQGYTGFHASALDAHLRTTGVEHVVIVGVSVNLGIVGTVIEAANRGYDVVVPADAVVGVPAEYGEVVLNGTIRSLATVTTTDAVLARFAD